MKRLFAAGLLMGGILMNAQNVQYINSLSAYSGDVNAGSARYMGMGGAMGALGGDISSTEQNPAGLAVAIASEVNVTLGLSSYKNETKFGNSFDSDDNTLLFQNIGGSFVFHNNTGLWNRFAIGMKYSQESLDNRILMGKNDNLSLVLEDPDDENITNTYTFGGYEDLTEGYKSKMTLDFGASYNDRLYLGLGLNLHSVNYENYITYADNFNGTNYYYYQNGTPYSVNTSGFSLSAGVIGKVNDNFRLGLAYHSPVWYSESEENFLYAPEEDIQVDEDGYRFANPDWYYSYFDMSTGGRLVGSAGLIIGKMFAFNVDYTYHMNGSYKYKPSNDFSSINQYFDDNLKNSHEVRAGGELRLDKFRVRAGYNYVGTPYDDFTLEANLGDSPTVVSQNFSELFRGNINRFSIGAGYDFGGFYLDAAYQYQTQNYKYVFGNTTYVSSTDGWVYLPGDLDADPNASYNYVADVKNNKGMFLLSAGWLF